MKDLSLLQIIFAFIILVAVVSAQSDGRYRPKTTTTRTSRPSPLFGISSNKARINDGRYRSNNDGKYRPVNNGKYRPGSDGKYIHKEVKYVHKDVSGGQYSRENVQYSGNGGNYTGGGKYIGGEIQFTGSVGQYFRDDNKSNGGINNGNNDGNNSGNNIGNKDGQNTVRIFGNKYDAGDKSSESSSENGSINKLAGSTVKTFQPVTRTTLTLRPTILGKGTGKGGNGWKIIRDHNFVQQDGYHYLYETENGILAEESGRVENIGQDLQGLNSKGFYEYTSDDGVLYRVDYVADVNGFVPQGEHILKVPIEIEKLLAYLSTRSANSKK